MPEEPVVYRVEIPLIISHEIGLDPGSLPEHRLLQLQGTRSLQLCESLFWLVRQLGLLPEHSGHIYSPASLHEALEAIGEIGQALASTSGEHLQRLEHLVDKGCEGKRKRKR
ncbi:MAG: hypothetical protein ABW208_26620 [Pyrinomonadaceae bacterium]